MCVRRAADLIEANGWSAGGSEIGPDGEMVHRCRYLRCGW